MLRNRIQDSILSLLIWQLSACVIRALKEHLFCQDTLKAILTQKFHNRRAWSNGLRLEVQFFVSTLLSSAGTVMLQVLTISCLRYNPKRYGV